MLDRLEVPSEPFSRRNPTAASKLVGLMSRPQKSRLLRPAPKLPSEKVPQATFSDGHRMRKTQRQLHTRAANRPTGTTKLLVRETPALSRGTIRAKQGISVETGPSANR